MDKLQLLIGELKVGARKQKSHLTRERDVRDENWSRLADLEARLREYSSADEDEPATSDGDSELPISPPLVPHRKTTSPCATRLNWGILQRELTQRGLQTLYADDDDCGGGDRPPGQAAVYASLQSALREVERLAHRSETLQRAADEAVRREEAAGRNLKEDSRRHAQRERELGGLAADAQREAARAEEATAISQRAAQEAIAEAAVLRKSLEKKERQLANKASEIEALCTQIEDSAKKEAQRQAAAKESLERIRRAITPSGARNLDTAAHPTTGAKLTAWQCARAYEAQLQVVEEELLAAKAEASLLRQRPSGLEASAALKHVAEDVARAQMAAKRADHELAAAREELAVRPTAADHERLRREASILTRRLARLEGISTSSFTFRSAAPPRAPSSRKTALLLEVVDELGLILECQDPLNLPKAAREMRRCATDAHALQCFVNDVSRAVFESGKAVVPCGLRPNGDPADVPEVLEGWVKDLLELERIRGALQELRHQMSRNGTAVVSTAPGADVLHAVSQLLNLSSSNEAGKRLQTQEASATCPSASRQPNHHHHHHQHGNDGFDSALILPRIAAEFLLLFKGRSPTPAAIASAAWGSSAESALEGVLPLMHRVHSELVAARTFLLSLKESLGLPKGATLEACANRVAVVLATGEGSRENGMNILEETPAFHLSAASSAALGQAAARRKKSLAALRSP